MKLSNKDKYLKSWAIEKRNEVAIPLLVLDYWTIIKKWDSPVENPATHSLADVRML